MLPLQELCEDIGDSVINVVNQSKVVMMLAAGEDVPLPAPGHAAAVASNGNGYGNGSGAPAAPAGAEAAAAAALEAALNGSRVPVGVVALTGAAANGSGGGRAGANGL